MTWFKVDDGLAFHAKTIAAGNAAMGLWVRAGSWSAHQLTDGFIPDNMVVTLGNLGQARRLVDARLWLRVDGGYVFHQWSEDGRQPTRERVEADRAEARERMKRAREAKRSGEVRANRPGTSGGVRLTRPDPSRPDLLEDSSEGGSLDSTGRGHGAPLYADRCEEHWDTPAPGPCGDCADVRKAREATQGDYRLRVVPALCGQCDERWIDTPTGAVHCPRCHPAEVAS